MADLTTRYLGLPLRNPLIVAASGLTGTVEGVGKAAAAGAGAVVLKSLFEEQLIAELSEAKESLSGSSHPEAEAFFSRAGMEEGARDYLKLVAGAAASGIPVIASVNCIGSARWAEFAARIEGAGADALELNLAYFPASPAEGSSVIEERLLDTVARVREATALPLAVKLGPGYASLPAMVSSLAQRGAAGIVLFNRFYRIDVDLASLSLRAGTARSSGDEYHESLRWISVLSGRASCDFAAGTGIHDAETVLKLIAVGASAAQLCSVIYRRGFGVIGEIARSMADWLESKDIPSIAALKGRLSQANSADPAAHMRLQYIHALTGIS
jgi:dihydroorotate dehydrogenase (fumarate)